MTIFGILVENVGRAVMMKSLEVLELAPAVPLLSLANQVNKIT